MKNLLERLANSEIIVADGALGTMLMTRGLKSGDCPEAWNLSYPEILAEIALEYLMAGAEIIQTNTFGASPAKLSFYSLQNQAEEINKRAVHVARNAVGDRAYISGSCGPSGKILKPYGDADPDDLYQSFRMQIKALIEAGVDLICIETMTDLVEANLAVRAAKDLSSSIPVIATMTFDQTPRGFFTIMGTSIENAASGLAGADIIGSNCGNGIDNMIAVAREFKKYSLLPLIIQSNAGLPRMQGTEIVYDETPDFMAEKAIELVEAGVSIIGGCCGTTPAHIRAIKKTIDSRKRR